MRFLPAELIKKKRAAKAHSRDELGFLVEAFVSGELPDYPMAAWLMAVFFQGMTAEETADFTHVMLHSGMVLDFKGLPGKTVDKHSTGGVGDKTSMILAPLAAACGVYVPMIAGRGLGHTGGTLDKLEAIPGFDINLSLEQFKKQVERIGVCIIGQTQEICPADKKIYALRDVTGTVESLPLICASIMSKKLAEGIDGLVLDVKFGSGAFMKTLEQAAALDDKLMEIGAAHGKKVSSVLTNMDQPLGRFIGNSLEIGECVAILKNEPFMGHSADAFADTRELSLELAGQMVWLGGKAASDREGYEKARQALQSGAGYAKFEEMCKAQGGRLEGLAFAAKKHVVTAPSTGYVAKYDTEKIGLAALSTGAGRLKKTDAVDYAAGVEIHKKIGDAVQAGEPLFTVHGDDGSKHAPARDMLLSATNISLQKPQLPSLIAKRKVN